MSHITHENIESIADLVAKKINEIDNFNKTHGKWLTIPEAMEYAKVKRRTLLSWINEGYIYGFKRTGEWIVDRESIDQWYSSERIDI